MEKNLESERVYLRRFRVDDYNDVYEYLSLEEVVRYEPYSPMSLEECKKETIQRSNSASFYAIILKSEEKLIGNIYFNQKQPYKYMTYELGYVLNPKYQLQGYATEAVHIILKHGFTKCNVHRVIANCNQNNLRSIRLLERVGMRRETDSKQDVFFNYAINGDPNWLDSYMFAILSDEYLSKG